MKHDFPTFPFVVQQILGILGSQIKPKRIFSVVGVLTSLRCCRLGIDNLDKLVMIMKNWSIDAWIDCPRERQSITEFLLKMWVSLTKMIHCWMQLVISILIMN
jgi:hypothetical protein